MAKTLQLYQGTVRTGRRWHNCFSQSGLNGLKACSVKDCSVRASMVWWQSGGDDSMNFSANSLMMALSIHTT